MTSPDGRIYEVPAEVAASYAVSAWRAKELGHLPIFPYTVMGLPKLKHNRHAVGGVTARSIGLPHNPFDHWCRVGDLSGPTG